MKRALVFGAGGFISAETEIMRNSVLIKINMTHATDEARIPRYFLFLLRSFKGSNHISLR
jgi:hypothetical protein